MNISTCVEVALFQANTYLRDGRVATQNRFCDTIEASAYPNIALAHVAKRLGRHKALAVGIERETFERALKAFREGALA